MISTCCSCAVYHIDSVACLWWQDAFIAAGGIVRLVRLMLCRESDPRVVDGACVVLRTLAKCSDATRCSQELFVPDIIPHSLK